MASNMALDLSKSDPKSMAWVEMFDILVKYGEEILGAVRLEHCFECKDQPNQSAQYMIHEHSCERPLNYFIGDVLERLQITIKDKIVQEFRAKPMSANVQMACEELIEKDISELLLEENEKGRSDIFWDFAKYWSSVIPYDNDD